MYKANITNDEVNELPLILFDGKISVMDSKDQSEAEEYLLRQRVIGFDTESRATFKKGAPDTISMVQLSGPDRAFLFRVNKHPLSSVIIKILQSRTIVKVGLAIKDDLHKIRLVNPVFFPHNFVDLQTMVKNYGINEMGLKKISCLVLNHRISKAQRLSNWNAVQLTEAQIRYAATDAWICVEIYKKLIASTL